MKPCRAFAAALAAAFALPAAAQYASDALYDWKEGEVPPAPAWSTKGLIDADLPCRSVRVGMDPATITLDIKTGIVARGVSAVNASYEGIRCSTGEWRVYARQIPGEEWQPASSGWQVMRDARSPHAYWFAKTGICEAHTMRTDTRDIVWKVQRKDAAASPCYIAILLEFHDAFMVLRLLTYTALLLEHLAKEPEIKESGQLPPVLPIVLYNGSQPWSCAQDVAELFAPMPDGLRPFAPHMRYLLLEEHKVPRQALQDA